MVISLEVRSFYRIVLAILCYLFFHVILSIAFSKFGKNCVGVLIAIALNLQIAFGKLVIFTILILLIHEHGIFPFLICSSIYFYKDLKYLSYVVSNLLG